MFTYFIVIANIYFFQIDRLEPSFTDSVFRFRFRFRIPDSGFYVLVLQQEYLSNGLGTADQPLRHEQQWVLQ